MTKTFLVLVTVADEKQLKEAYQEGTEVSAKELKNIDLKDMVEAELGWSIQSGLNHNVVKELTPDEVDMINNDTWQN